MRECRAVERGFLSWRAGIVVTIRIELTHGRGAAVNSSQQGMPREIKVVDEGRRPRDWNELLSPWQCAVFFKRFDAETPLSQDGAPFANMSDATFLLFDSLESARGFCEARVKQLPHMICEIFDAEGKAKPPILAIEHPSVAEKNELSARSIRARKILAIVLILCAPALFGWDHRANGTLVMPTFLGISLILAALRTLHWNMAGKGRVEEQERRIREHVARERDSSENPNR
jgi:hypothetical protein